MPRFRRNLAPGQIAQVVAMQFDGTNARECLAFADALVDPDAFDPQAPLIVGVEGDAATVAAGQWLVLDFAGNLNVVADDVFRDHYTAM